MKARNLFILATVVGVAAVAPVAHAADTTVSVTLDGNLTISAPASVNLGTVSAAAGSTTSASLGTVTVADGRGSLLGWNVTAVTATSTMSTDDDPADEIALSATGPLGWVTGTVTASGSSLITGVGAGLGGFLSTTAIPVATAVATSGGGTYTYDPTLTFTVPPNAQAGTYSVVVTQTVS
jgi:hypothetical protein